MHSWETSLAKTTRKGRARISAQDETFVVLYCGTLPRWAALFGEVDTAMRSVQSALLHHALAPVSCVWPWQHRDRMAEQEEKRKSDCARHFVNLRPLKKADEKTLQLECMCGRIPSHKHMCLARTCAGWRHCNCGPFVAIFFLPNVCSLHLFTSGSSGFLKVCLLRAPQRTCRGNICVRVASCLICSVASSSMAEFFLVTSLSTVL